MTTKPKAPQFRVRRVPRANPMQAPEIIADAIEADVVQPEPQANPESGQLFEAPSDSDGFGDVPFPGSAASERPRKSRGAISKALEETAIPRPQAAPASSETASKIEADVDAIRNEGLSGRQLRVARRVAHQYKIESTSDFDAIRQLRAKGIDPFKRTSAMMNMVTVQEEKQLPVPSETSLPQPAQTAKMPPPEIADRLSRENEISQIQRDIAKRRNRKTALALSRLAVFVGIPTALCGIYFYTIATPMYATESSFLIQQAEAPAAASSLFSGTSFGGSQDSIAVQNYLESRDAMLRLDRDVGFKSHFASESIDPIQRLPSNPSNEQAYKKVYSKLITIGYDPTEGLVHMEVVAADPFVSQQFSEALIEYAEESVDHLTQRLRKDQMQGAEESLADAETKMRDAQENVIALQEQLGIISPEAETGALLGQISGFETQLQQKLLQLQQLLDNTRPNQARVEGTRGDIRRLESLITDLRSQMTEAQGTTGSLARVSAELRMAEVELQTRQVMAQQALQALETSRGEANRQTRYLSMSSSPVAPDEPTYPRKFENTMLAFLLFSGVYLMFSLTAAVLREQISA